MKSNYSTYNYYLFSFRWSVPLTYIPYYESYKTKSKFTFLYIILLPFLQFLPIQIRSERFTTPGAPEVRRPDPRGATGAISIPTIRFRNVPSVVTIFSCFLSVLIPCLVCDFFFAGYNPNQKCWVFLILWKLTFPNVLF